MQSEFKQFHSSLLANRPGWFLQTGTLVKVLNYNLIGVRRDDQAVALALRATRGSSREQPK